MNTMNLAHANDDSLAHLIGASLPSPAACQAAIDLLRTARGNGASRDILWRLAGIAVWDGLPAARSALAAASHAAPALPTEADDRISFDLDEAEALPTNLVQPRSQLTLSL